MGNKIITPKLVLGQSVKSKVSDSSYDSLRGPVASSVSTSVWVLVRGLVVSPVRNSVWNPVSSIINSSMMGEKEL